MREIWAADSETDPFLHGRLPKPFIWGAYQLERDEYEEFETFGQMLEFLESKETEIIVYAHNGGKFDWHFGLDYLENYSDILVINGRIAKFKIGRVEFRDSFSILPVPLADMAKDEFDYRMLEEDVRHKYMDKIRAYLKSDCVYLAQHVNAFIEQYGLHLTLASAALASWRKISKYHSPKSTEAFYEEIEPFYCGGRVECNHVGEVRTPFVAIDINSAYPFAMMNKHPWGHSYELSEELPETDDEIERCFIELDAQSLGAFPFREANRSINFPNDGIVRNFHITGWEYIAARDAGILGGSVIRSVYRFHQSITFKAYVDHFYELKKSSKNGSPEYLFAKLMLNSLYGKFGANPNKYEENIIVDMASIGGAEKDGYEFSGDIGPWALMGRPVPEHKRNFLNVAVAASITGFVRAYMWKTMRQCENVYYCDTDSIIAKAVNGVELDGTKLGAWDLEAECVYGAFAGKKLYAIKTGSDDPKKKWKTASKGVRLSHEELIRVARGETIKYERDAPTYSIHKPPRFTTRRIRRKTVN